MKRYICDKENNEKMQGYLDFNQIDGFKIKPRNKVKYDGIEVSKMTLVEPSLIEMVLKKKTKRKTLKVIGALKMPHYFMEQQK